MVKITYKKYNYEKNSFDTCEGIFLGWGITKKIYGLFSEPSLESSALILTPNKQVLNISLDNIVEYQEKE